MLRLITSSRASLRRLPTNLTWGLQLQLQHRTFVTAGTKSTSTSSASNRKMSTSASNKQPLTPVQEAKRQQKIAKQAKLREDLKQARAEKRLRAEINRAEESEKRQERRAKVQARKLATIAKARERRDKIRLKKAMKLRRPGNAYTFFSKQRFPAIFASTKNLGETSRRLAAEWKSLSPQQKKPFQDAYAAARQQHSATKAQKPKRPLTSYLNWVAQERTKLPKVKGMVGAQQVIKELAQRWSKLAEEEKARYAPSPADMAEYSRAMQAYKAKFLQQYQQLQQQRQQQQQQAH